jgi:hypothetical protein
MSAASEVNLKQTLRKLEFPLCAKEALHKIGKTAIVHLFRDKNANVLTLR